MFVIRPGENQHKIASNGRPLRLNTRQHPRVEIGSGGQRIVRQAGNPAQRHQRRSRVSVMPIFSVPSAIASLTILTVTASTRSS